MKLNLSIMKYILAIFLLIFTNDTIKAQSYNLMSYNIKFANETDGENSWSYRKVNLLDQLKFYQPDIFGVQEALEVQVNFFKDNLKSYNYVGKGRDDGKTKGEYSAIFYDSNKFRVKEENTFWLSETPDVVSVGWDASMERICTYARFEDLDTKTKFWVFNAHLDHVGPESRKNALDLISRKIKKSVPSHEAVILMGDFNIEPDSEALHTVNAKLNDAKLISEVDFGPKGTYNGFNLSSPLDRRIDYIYVSKEVKVKKYAVLSSVIDSRFISDHFPVYVEIEVE